MYESHLIDATTCTKCELCVKICPAGNEVVESMILGWPKVKFKHAIVRPRKKVAYLS